MTNWMVIAFCSIVSTAAAAQGSSGTDAMGPHANSGRGCNACHTPHSPTIYDERVKLRKVPLWGEVDFRAYGAGARAYLTAKTPESTGVLLCLTCHDGNYASKATIKNTIYESMPGSYGTFRSVPTLTDAPGVLLGVVFSEHPAGLDARVGCGGAKEWDCTIDKGLIVMSGPNSARFVSAYGLFRKPHPYEGREVVVCTTCHNPHSRNVISVAKESESRAFHSGVYGTKFFLRAPYDPSHASVASNVSAQFCRQCHADLSNEMNGSTAGTII